MSIVYWEEKYLIDTTPAVAITKDMFETNFYKEKCFFPEEVLYELRDNCNYERFIKNVIKIDKDILYFLQTTVMTGLTDNSKLVDLYQNKGNGDVFIIATILSKQYDDRGSLFRTRWVIVTEDKGVMEAAYKYDIDCIKKSEFLKLIKDKT